MEIYDIVRTKLNERKSANKRELKREKKGSLFIICFLILIRDRF